MRVLLFSIVTLFIPLLVFTQQLNVEWDQAIGGTGFDQLFTSTLGSNGHIVLGGYSESNISGDKTENSTGGQDFWLVVLNSEGSTIFDKTFGGAGNDQMLSAFQTSDGGYILGGMSESGITGAKTEAAVGSFDYWIIKTNNTGSIEWQNNIGSIDFEVLYTVQETTDGGFFVAGYSLGGISGEKTEASNGGADIWVLKLDAVGNIVWQNTFGGSGNESQVSAEETIDGGFIVSCQSDSNISGDKTENSYGGYDIWVVKLDNQGNIVWDKTLGGSGQDYVGSIKETVSGDFIVGSSSESDVSGLKSQNSYGGRDFWIIRLDSLGVLEWEYTFGATVSDEIRSIDIKDNGNILAIGYSNSDVSGDKSEQSNGSNDFWILELDSLGNLLWEKTVGGDSNDQMLVQNASFYNPDGSIIVGGISESTISGDKTESNVGGRDYWVVKLSCNSTSSYSTNECSPFYLPSGAGPYTLSGVYQDTIPNTAGCDSIMTITVNAYSIANQGVSVVSSELCDDNTGTSVITTSSEAGVTYYLREENTDSLVAGPISGTGAGLNFSTGHLPDTISMNVYAENPIESGCLEFHDQNYVLVNNDPELQLNQGTIEAWINTTNAGSFYRGIVVKQGAYALFMLNNELVSYDWNTGTLSSGQFPNDGAWHHVAFSFDASVPGGSKIYLDGIEVASHTWNPSYQTESLVIGNGYNISGTQHFNGKIDEVRVWNTVRTPSEIMTYKDSCLAGNEIGLLAYFPMEDGMGSTTVTDISVNGNDGTLTFMDPNADWVTGKASCTTCSSEMNDVVTVNVNPTYDLAENPVVCSGDSYTFPDGTTQNNIMAQVVHVSNLTTVATSCDSTITTTVDVLVDTQDPTASNPLPISVQCAADVPAPDITVVTDESDNCGTPTVSFVSDVSDNQTCPETITRTYSVTDNASNQITVTQTITVNDDTNPTASNPAPISVECSAAIPAPDVLVVTDEADNCTTAPVVAHVSDVSDGQTNPETITRTYSVTDDCNNSISVTQIISVNDVSNPTASNPSPLSVECIADAPVDITVVTDEADNCTASPVVAHVSDVSDNNTCPEVITRTYSVTDDAGNSINVTQTITVDDQTDPVPDNATLSDVTAECQSSPTAPSATDNCSGTLTATPDVTFPITTLGTTTVTWTYTDNCGNTAQQTQDVIITEIDNSVTVTGITITAAASGYSYQWVDCDNSNAPISGETGQSFTPTANGNYAVEITDGTCTVTSACEAITTVGVMENTFGSDISVYPNPTEGDITINLGANYNNITVEVKSMTGQIIQNNTYESANNIELNINGTTGLYLIIIHSAEGENAVLRVIKQ